MTLGTRADGLLAQVNLLRGEKRQLLHVLSSEYDGCFDVVLVFFGVLEGGFGGFVGLAALAGGRVIEDGAGGFDSLFKGERGGIGR